MQPVFPGTRSPRIVQSRQNVRVKELRAGFAHAGKTERGLISIEGQHLLSEAVVSGLRLAAVFVSLGAESLLDAVSIPGETEIIALPPDVFSSAAVTDSPQGIAALVEPAVFTLEDALSGARNTARNPASQPPLILVLAGLQDPGNLGTLIRSAEAFGGTGVITLPGTVSLWNQKVLRASSGSIFRLPVVAAQPDELFTALAQHRIPALAAVAAAGEPLARHDLSRASALILGNEGSGIPQEILRHANALLTIPCPGPVESLNAAVAGSILLYEASRQRVRETAKAGQP
jgi:TrmH family RNA methyltransferase